jgi:hypothetical protein
MDLKRNIKKVDNTRKEMQQSLKSRQNCGTITTDAGSVNNSPKMKIASGSLPCSPKADKIIKLKSPASNDKKKSLNYRHSSDGHDIILEDENEERNEERRVSLCIINNEGKHKKLK